MTNVISLVVDSVSYDFLDKKQIAISPTPFLDSLKKESIVATNLWSQGPYTDAATKGLFTGTNVLDDFGYYFKTNSAPENHFSVFKKNGYETIGFFYPFFIYGNKIRKDIDSINYTSGFAFESEWGGIFRYYSEILDTRDLLDYEKQLLIKRTRLMFECWLGFYQDAMENTECISLIKNKLRGVEESYSRLQDEYKDFLSEPYRYVLEILKKKENHILFEIDQTIYNADTDHNFIKRIILESKAKFYRKINLLNIKANLLHNRPSPKRTYYAMVKYLQTKNRGNLKFVRNFCDCLNTIRKQKKDFLLPKWEYAPSAKKTLDAAIDKLCDWKERRTNNPFYLSLHIEDPHKNINFFSYDINTPSEIDEEFQVLADYVSKLRHHFIGNIEYYLSIRYVDYCIERFVSLLRENGLWDNTIFLVVADHGSSFGYYPLHMQPVNCFDSECYHIPLLIRTPEGKNDIITKYCSSKDVYPTLLDLLSLPQPNGFSGISILDKRECKKYIITEYAGPGCPDLLSKKLWLSIRDEYYLVAIKATIHERIDKQAIVEVYDLKIDPQAITNIVDSIDIECIKYLLDALNERFTEIRNNTIEYEMKLRDEFQNNKCISKTL